MDMSQSIKLEDYTNTCAKHLALLSIGLELGSRGQANMQACLLAYHNIDLVKEELGLYIIGLMNEQSGVKEDEC
jgi:hypothetical protein